MTFDWTQIILNIVTGLISGGLSAWITYWLAFRRFRAEKWWERRADAYSRIIEALHNSQKYPDTHINYMWKHSEVPTEKDEALRKAAEAAHDEILRAVDVGMIFLSSAALDRLRRFVRESENIGAEGFDDYVMKHYELIKTCLNDLAQLAREDLGTTR